MTSEEHRRNAAVVESFILLEVGDNEIPKLRVDLPNEPSAERRHVAFHCLDFRIHRNFGQIDFAGSGKAGVLAGVFRRWIGGVLVVVSKKNRAVSLEGLGQGGFGGLCGSSALDCFFWLDQGKQCIRRARNTGNDACFCECFGAIGAPEKDGLARTFIGGCDHCGIAGIALGTIGR